MRPVNVYSFPPDANDVSVCELMLMLGGPDTGLDEDGTGNPTGDEDEDENLIPITATAILAIAAITAAITVCH